MLKRGTETAQRRRNIVVVKWNGMIGNEMVMKKVRSEQRMDVWHGCCVGSCIAVKSGRADAWTCGTNSYG